jgi:hypothetical protein
MDKSARKLDEQDPGMYIVQVRQSLQAKNKLQREIQHHFYRTQHISLVAANQLRAWRKSQEDQVAEFNAKHPKCQPVQLMWDEPSFLDEEAFNVYTQFISLSVQRVRRVISEVKPETEQSA